MSGKHRKVAEVPADEIRDAAARLGYPDASVDLAAPMERSSWDPMAPTGVRTGARATRLADRRSQAKRNRMIAAVAGASLVVASVGWVFFHGDSAPAPAAGTGIGERSQTTVLVQILDGAKTAVVNALIAHDTKDSSGIAALLPGELSVNVAGIGAATLRQTSTYSGSNASALAVSDAMGVIVDGTWTLDSVALARLVDSAGGVEVSVDREIVRAAKAGVAATVLLPAGQQKLDGSLAAIYATYLADGEPEAKRLARFADVWRELLPKLPTSAQQLATTIGGLGQGSRTTMKLERLGGLIAGTQTDLAAGSMTFENVPTRSLDSGGTNAGQVIDPVPTESLVARAFADSRPPKRATGELRVLVQNGLGTPGLGEQARTKLLKASLTYVNGGNAQSFGQQTSVILIRDASVDARAEGQSVATALGLPVGDLQIAAQGQSLADVIVVLGADFKP